MSSLLREFHQARDGINPDRYKRHDDCIQPDQAYDTPTSCMHHAFKHSENMEELARKAWHELGKPYHFTEPQVERIMQHVM